MVQTGVICITDTKICCEIPILADTDTKNSQNKTAKGYFRDGKVG